MELVERGRRRQRRVEKGRKWGGESEMNVVIEKGMSVMRREKKVEKSRENEEEKS